MRKSVEQDDWIKTKIHKLNVIDSSNNGGKNSQYQVENDLLRYESRIVLSPTSPSKARIMEEHHATPAAGCNEMLKT